MASHQQINQEILTAVVDNSEKLVSTAKDFVGTIANTNKNNQVLSYAPTTQIAVGVTAGYAGGWVCSKMGKLALVLAGTAAVVIPLAEHAGYINVNWKKVESDAKTAHESMERELKNVVGKTNIPNLNLQDICQQNLQGTLAAVGGFVLGCAL